MSKKEKILFTLSLVAVPVIIYFYFLKWKTTTIYGDDLYIYNSISHASSFSDLIHLSTSGGKYRPVYSYIAQLIFNLFQKNLNGYYLFNVFIQTINTYLLALLINLFLRSPILSVWFSLIGALSRFSIYNITQLFNGGPLEGLAITFFLLSLFFILKAMTKSDLSRLQIQKAFLWGILFANLCIYTHERYIVLLPFIILVVLFFPGIKQLTAKQKILLSIIPALSVVLNIVIKKYVYSMPFFVGTSGAGISFSSAIPFLTDGILSIIQINSGPEYVTGMRVTALKGFNLILTLLLACSAITILTIYLWNIRKAFALKQEDKKNKFFIFISLSVLFIFCLVPAISTIRLEQRWLQASFYLFILMLVISLTDFKLNTRLILVPLFIISFVWVNFTYLNNGARNFFQSAAERSALHFKAAINNGTIHSNPDKLYVWKYVDVDGKGALIWYLADGYFFEFYQKKSKKIIFIDSLYHKEGNAYTTSLPNFNKDSAQILYVKDNVTDITGQYLKDSLKSFTKDLEK